MLYNVCTNVHNTEQSLPEYEFQAFISCVLIEHGHRRPIKLYFIYLKEWTKSSWEKSILVRNQILVICDGKKTPVCSLIRFLLYLSMSCKTLPNIYSCIQAVGHR